MNWTGGSLVSENSCRSSSQEQKWIQSRFFQNKRLEKERSRKRVRSPEATSNSSNNNLDDGRENGSAFSVANDQELEEGEDEDDGDGQEQEQEEEYEEDLNEFSEDYCSPSLAYKRGRWFVDEEFDDDYENTSNKRRRPVIDDRRDQHNSSPIATNFNSGIETSKLKILRAPNWTGFSPGDIRNNHSPDVTGEDTRIVVEDNQESSMSMPGKNQTSS